MTPIYYRSRGLSFGWWANDGDEPPHVHVFRGSDRGASAKFWIRPDGEILEYDHIDLSPAEERLARRILSDNRSMFLEEWFNRFGSFGK